MRWPGRSPRIDLDQPVPGMEVGDSLTVAGWAFSRDASIARIEVACDGRPAVVLAHGAARPDVAALHGCDAACGFEGVLALGGLRDGLLALRVTAVDTRGRRAGRKVTVRRLEGA